MPPVTERDLRKKNPLAVIILVCTAAHGYSYSYGYGYSYGWLCNTPPHTFICLAKGVSIIFTMLLLLLQHPKAWFPFHETVMKEKKEHEKEKPIPQEVSCVITPSAIRLHKGITIRFLSLCNTAWCSTRDKGSDLKIIIITDLRIRQTWVVEE